VSANTVDERITRALAEAKGPVALVALRANLRIRNATLYERLAALTAAGTLVRSPAGYRLART
jgi:DNA-binding IclR family transcriptional regulator